MKIRICLAGANGHVGRELVKNIVESAEFELVAALGHSSVGRRLTEVLSFPCSDVYIDKTLAEAYARQPFDVLIDYTRPEAVFETVKEAIAHGVHCVIGTSGLSDGEYDRLHQAAQAKGVGVFAAGNFSVTAALMAHFAQVAARFIPHWELLDYGTESKADAPSGTSRELAFLLGSVRQPQYKIPPGQVHGHPEARGASLNGSQVHSLRLPGFYSSSEVIFGLPGERLTIRHDSISYAPYVAGTLLAVRKVSDMVGLVRGLDKLLGL